MNDTSKPNGVLRKLIDVTRLKIWVGNMVWILEMASKKLVIGI